MALGTVEPDYRDDQPVQFEGDASYVLAFVRGAVNKYKGSGNDADLVKYIHKLVNYKAKKK